MTAPTDSADFGSFALPKDALPIGSEFKELPSLDRQTPPDQETTKRPTSKDTNEAVTAGSKESSPEKWNVKLGGHVQLDYINWAEAQPNITEAQDYFEFRRLRLVADGSGYGVYDFRLQMTLEPETVGETRPIGSVMSPDVKDAYLSMNELPWLGRFRIGNFLSHSVWSR